MMKKRAIITFSHVLLSLILCLTLSVPAMATNWIEGDSGGTSGTTPGKPTDPTDPTDPENPGTDPENPGSTGGTTGGATTTPPTTTIPDDDVPLAGAPEEDLTTIEDEDVPLSDVPKTGDNSLIWGILTAVSGTGLAWLALDKKRKGAAE